MGPWKRRFLLKIIICRFHAKFVLKKLIQCHLGALCPCKTCWAIGKFDKCYPQTDVGFTTNHQQAHDTQKQVDHCAKTLVCLYQDMADIII